MDRPPRFVSLAEAIQAYRSAVPQYWDGDAGWHGGTPTSWEAHLARGNPAAREAAEAAARRLDLPEPTVTAATSGWADEPTAWGFDLGRVLADDPECWRTEREDPREPVRIAVQFGVPGRALTEDLTEVAAVTQAVVRHVCATRAAEVWLVYHTWNDKNLRTGGWPIQPAGALDLDAISAWLSSEGTRLGAYAARQWLEMGSSERDKAVLWSEPLREITLPSGPAHLVVSQRALIELTSAERRDYAMRVLQAQA